MNVPDEWRGKIYKGKESYLNWYLPGGYWERYTRKICKGIWKVVGIWEEEKQVYWKMSLDEPSLTILTTPPMKQTDRCHQLKIDHLLLEESARIQSFPDDWEFCGSMANKYKQIGNAVPCNLAYEMGKEIIKSLKEN